MTTSDPFTHFDGAYVLGALEPAEAAEFEAHLAGCVECRARLQEIQDVPNLMAGLPLEAFQIDDTLADAPDTLLPALLRSVKAERRRRRLLTTSLAGLAAACLVALAIAVWPSSQPAHKAPAPLAMQPLGNIPVTATAALTDKAWGTEIDLTCDYAGGTRYNLAYRLVVVDKQGATQQLGTWLLLPGKTVHYTSGTALKRGQIARITITSPTDTPVLQLNL